VSRLLLLIASTFLIGCNSASRVGEPCGGGQYADSRVVLPDTGIDAGDTLLVDFLQHDTQELSELVIWHLWPFASGVIDSEPDPRVRLVTASGRVLLDSIGSRYNQPENRYNRPTWYVFTWIRDSDLRNAFFEGFQNETLWVELWSVGSSQPATRVRLRTDRVGVGPTGLCL
jgi:hypothetical protein